MTEYKRKLIEVALPLEAINEEAYEEAARLRDQIRQIEES